jgi:hypothetical protein
MTSLLRTFSRAFTFAGLAALGWSVVAQAQTPTVFNACVTPLTGLLYQPKEAGKCFLPSHHPIKWTDALGAFFGATTLGGDLSGTLPSPTVKGLRGHPVSATNPTAGQILIWDGSVWMPGNQVGGSSGAAGGALTGTYPNPGLADGAVSEAKLAFNPATQAELDAASATAAAAAATLQTNINAASEALNAYRTLLANSGGTANAAGNPVSWTQLKDVPSGVISGGGAGGVAGGDLSGNYPNPAVAKLQGTAVSSTAPTSGQVLAFNGTSWTPAESPTGGSATTGQNSVSLFGSEGVSFPFMHGGGESLTLPVPGLSTTIDVPANSVTIVSTDGGAHLFGPSAAALGVVVDIKILIDGASPPGSGWRRISAVNNGLPDAFANWSMQLSVGLTPGLHTIEVEAQVIVANGNVDVSGGPGSLRQGVLTVTTLKR